MGFTKARPNSNYNTDLVAGAYKKHKWHPNVSVNVSGNATVPVLLLICSYTSHTLKICTVLPLHITMGSLVTIIMVFSYRDIYLYSLSDPSIFYCGMLLLFVRITQELLERL